MRVFLNTCRIVPVYNACGCISWDIYRKFAALKKSPLSQQK